MKYAEVLLPLPLDNTFTYRIPEAMAHLAGLYCRVVASFGKKLYYTGIVVAIHEQYPEQNFEIKELHTFLDEKPVINASQLTFWRWMSSYYLCTLGDVCKAALPKRLKIESETEEKLNEILKKGFKPKTNAYRQLADTTSDEDVREAIVLTLKQKNAFEAVKKSFETHNITLLHGVIASRKTEIYIRLIQDVVSKGLQTLYLLPEIALTTQITAKLSKIFGAKLLVYTSGISDNKRAEIWNRLLHSDEALVVLGVRSSVFLPFSRLGLVIVDEEQDSSYKQQDPAPRYHARNAAIMLAHQHGAKALLGSCIPSLESYLWAIKGKYGYVIMDNSAENHEMPTIAVVNVSELRRKKRMKDTLFSPMLKEKMEEALLEGEQVILFQNRRGFALYAACRQCEKISHCANCDVSMTYHKQRHRLECHYCGYSIPFPNRCPSCGSEDMKLHGFGTEKIEEDIAALFPTAQVARVDFDTAHANSAHKRIIADFEDGKTQILIGTQMITKGFDSARVRMVGLLNIDAMMNIPDFRAYERTFQLLVHISRYAAGRDARGCVIIQTSQGENIFMKQAQELDYQGMAQTQLIERHQFGYPPYTRLILLVLRSKNEQILEEIAEIYAEKLRFHLTQSVSGPVCPPVTRIQMLFVRKIMLKTELSIMASEVRKVLETVRIEMQQIPLFKQIILHYDVDPQ